MKITLQMFVCVQLICVRVRVLDVTVEIAYAFESILSTTLLVGTSEPLSIWCLTGCFARTSGLYWVASKSLFRFGWVVTQLFFNSGFIHSVDIRVAGGKVGVCCRTAG